MNGALAAINSHIEETQTKSDQKYIESLSADELERIFRKMSFETPAKVLIMGLVHLKRLDICTENSIKVYKIRRFY